VLGSALIYLLILSKTTKIVNDETEKEF